MSNRRFILAFAVAAAVTLSLGSSAARAQRFLYWPGYGYPYGPIMNGPLTEPYTPYANYSYYYYTEPAYTPYVAPFPAYGILPPPFTTVRHYESQGTTNYGTNGTTGPEARLDYTPRARASLYPALPYEKSAQEKLADLRRVRYEITVPYANAEVYIDGVKTKQKGLKRTFVTPPMQEDRYYTADIKVTWVDQYQKARERSQAFTFVAGETIRHDFKE